MSDDTDQMEFWPAEIVSEALSDRPATTTLLDSIFIPGRVPKDLKLLVDELAADKEMLTKQLMAEAPLLRKKVSHPYWKKGANVRPFDAVTLSVYSAVCVADDRHLLEVIVSIGGMYVDLSGLTVRQGIELSQLNVNYDLMPDQYLNLLDKKIFSEEYDYFLVEFSRLFEALAVAPGKVNRNKVFDRLRRLSTMTLTLNYELDGEALPKYDTDLRLVDRRYIPLLVMDGIKNKKSVNSDTSTHMIVGVHKTFTASLLTEGAISRKRFVSVYPDLRGKHAIQDWFKFVDTHKREYVHGKYLKDMIAEYLENKVRLSKQHNSRHTNNILKEVLERKDLLLRDFNLLLVERQRGNSTDWMFQYLTSTGRDEAK